MSVVHLHLHVGAFLYRAIRLPAIGPVCIRKHNCTQRRTVLRPLMPQRYEGTGRSSRI